MADIEQIESWTPKEFHLLIEGYTQRRIDTQELNAWSAMATGYAVNAGKKAQQHKIFNARKARLQLKEGFVHKEDEIKEMIRLNRAAQGFNPAAHFRKKGGSA